MRKPAALLFISFIALLASTIVRAQESGQNYNVRFYFLDLNVSDSSTYIEGHAAIHMTVNDQTGSQVRLDMSQILHTDSVKVNQKSAIFSHSENVLNVTLPVLSAGDSLVIIDVYYYGLGKAAGEVQGVITRRMPR